MATSEDEEKVRMLADATGRSEEDIRADLADDGVINESNRTKTDLVTQLKEAAELITTVQNINKKVSDNTVLNGGDNKTEVAVETTLEGDIVDRAIDSVERKVEKLKKIALMFAPVFLLIGGGGAYGMMDSSDDSDDTFEDFEIDGYIVIWGCTDYDAENYDPYANEDDGSCYWEPDCESEWEYRDLSSVDNEQDSITVEQEFTNVNWCDVTLDGEFEVIIVDENGHETTHEFTAEFTDFFAVSHTFENLTPHTYRVELMFTSYDGSYWNSPHNPMFNIEKNEEPEPEPETCNGTASFYEVTHQWTNHTNETANITVSWDADWSCDEERYVELDLYIVNESGEMEYMQVLSQTLNGETRFTTQYTVSNLSKNETFTVLLAIWVDEDGWRQDDEWQTDTKYIYM